MISSFLLQDIPRHTDTRLFEVREAFKRSLLPGTWFSVAYSRIYRNIFSPPPALRGPLRGACALRATDAEPAINALLGTINSMSLVSGTYTVVNTNSGT